MLNIERLFQAYQRSTYSDRPVRLEYLQHRQIYKTLVYDTEDFEEWNDVFEDRGLERAFGEFVGQTHTVSVYLNPDFIACATSHHLQTLGNISPQAFDLDYRVPFWHDLHHQYGATLQQIQGLLDGTPQTGHEAVQKLQNQDLFERLTGRSWSRVTGEYDLENGRLMVLQAPKAWGIMVQQPQQTSLLHWLAPR